MNQELLKFLIEFDSIENDNALIGHFMGLEIQDFYAIGQSVLAFKTVVPDEKKLEAYELIHGNGSRWNLLKLDNFVDEYGKVEWKNIEENLN